MQYTPLILRMNIHRRGKSGCENSFHHYRNFCKNTIFSLQVIEKLRGNGYENGIKDNNMLEYRLQREDYWIKTLRTVYLYVITERIKFTNENRHTGKLFPPIPRYDECFIDTRTQSKITNHNLSSDIEIFFNFSK